MKKLKEILEQTYHFLEEKLEPVTEKVLELHEKNRKTFYVICGLVTIMLVCLILLITVAVKGKKKTVEVYGEKLELTEPLKVPDGSELPHDYTVNRTTKKSWTEEEAKEWFTVPSEEDVETLSKSNDNMVNEIIGAAP